MLTKMYEIIESNEVTQETIEFCERLKELLLQGFSLGEAFDFIEQKIEPKELTENQVTRFRELLNLGLPLGIAYSLIKKEG